MSIFKSLIGVARELLTLKDPNNKYAPPQLISETKDACGHVVEQIIKADSSADASRHLAGHTMQGNKSVVVTKTGYKTYRIHTE